MKSNSHRGTPAVRSHCWQWVHWVWVSLLLSATALQAQYIVSSTNAFQAWSGPTPFLTEETVANGNNELSTAKKASVVGMELVNGSNVTYEMGTFANQSGASALRMIYKIDTTGSGPNGSFVVLFDTDRNGFFDSGIGFNFAATAGTTPTFSRTSESFTLTVGSGLSSAGTGLASNIAFTTGALLTKYTEVASAAGGAITVSIAFLISDVNASWSPVLGPTSLTPTTAFTASSLSANSTYSGTYGTGTGAVYDWYSTSATTFDVGSVAIPETSTNTSIGALAAASGLVAWRRRQRKRKENETASSRQA